MATATTTRTASWQEVANDAMARWNVPGLVVGIVENGRREVHPFGVANLETNTPVVEQTLFQYGSISKIVTATAIMQLVEGWRIDLDAPVKTYLPEFKLATAEATETVTTRHLLTHRTGFWGDDFTDYGRGDDALSKAVAGLSRIRQVTEPGELWSYCNTGFQVLGALVEAFRRLPCEKAFRDRVLKPLAMENTFYFGDEAITHAAALGYNTPGEDEPTVGRPYAITRAMNAAGGCIGPVDDLLSFAEFHMGQADGDAANVLRDGARLQMQQPQAPAANMAPHWGLGWMLYTIDGEPAFGHGGSTNGFRASLLVVPGRSFAIACLTNGSRGSALYHEIEDVVLSERLGLKREPKPEAPPASDIRTYTGTYQAPGGVLTVELSGDRLLVHVDQRSAITLAPSPRLSVHAVPVGGDEFRVTDTEMVGSLFDFVRHADGSIRFMRSGGRLYEPVPSLPG
jgi:CubicO group peptidase (beta-lactamase class C family)